MKKNLLETLWALLTKDPRRLEALLRRFPDADALFAHLERYGRDELEDSLVKLNVIEWVEGKDLAEHPHRGRTHKGPYLFMRNDDRVVILWHEHSRVRKPFKLDFKSAELDSKYDGVEEFGKLEKAKKAVEAFVRKLDERRPRRRGPEGAAWRGPAPEPRRSVGAPHGYAALLDDAGRPAPDVRRRRARPRLHLATPKGDDMTVRHRIVAFALRRAARGRGSKEAN